MSTGLQQIYNVCRILSFMSLSWWKRASIDQQKQIVRMLNGDTSARWPFPGPRVRVWTKARERAQSRISHGLHAPNIERQVREDRRIFVDHYRRVGQFYGWRDGLELPANIRRCRYERCSRFFLITNRKTRLFCSENCGSKFRVLAMKRRNKERKLARVRSAMKFYRGRRDQKRRAARRARVTTNFITHAITQGEVPHNAIS